MNESQEFFIAQSIAHARTLPLPEAVVYLRGLLQSCVDSPSLDPIRQVYIGLSESDKQLELIQSAQLKFKLTNRG